MFNFVLKTCILQFSNIHFSIKKIDDISNTKAQFTKNLLEVQYLSFSSLPAQPQLLLNWMLRSSVDHVYESSTFPGNRIDNGKVCISMISFFSINLNHRGFGFEPSYGYVGWRLGPFNHCRIVGSTGFPYQCDKWGCTYRWT